MITEPAAEFYTCCDCGRLFMSAQPPRRIIDDPLCGDCAKEFAQTLSDLSARGVSVQIGAGDGEPEGSKTNAKTEPVQRYYRVTMGNRWVIAPSYDYLATSIQQALDNYPDQQVILETVEMSEQEYNALPAFPGWLS